MCKQALVAVLLAQQAVGQQAVVMTVNRKLVMSVRLL
jgi:hypothetical protein